jgi:hypothetical protein
MKRNLIIAGLIGFGVGYLTRCILDEIHTPTVLIDDDDDDNDDVAINRTAHEVWHKSDEDELLCDRITPDDELRGE